MACRPEKKVSFMNIGIIFTLGVGEQEKVLLERHVEEMA